jgi:hypothetical protein
MNLNNAITIEYSYIHNKKSSIRVIFEDKTIDIPLAEDNTDYQAIQQWIEDGGVVIDNGANNE